METVAEYRSPSPTPCNRTQALGRWGLEVRVAPADVFVAVLQDSVRIERFLECGNAMPREEFQEDFLACGLFDGIEAMRLLRVSL